MTQNNPAATLAPFRPQASEHWRGDTFHDQRILHWRGEDGSILYRMLGLDAVLTTGEAEWAAWARQVGAVHVE